MIDDDGPGRWRGTLVARMAGMFCCWTGRGGGLRVMIEIPGLGVGSRILGVGAVGFRGPAEASQSAGVAGMRLASPFRPAE